MLDGNVGYRVPGVVDSDEQKQQGRRADQEKSSVGIVGEQSCGDQKRGVGNKWEHCVPNPVFHHGTISSLTSRSANNYDAVNQTCYRTRADRKVDLRKRLPRSA